MPKRTVKHLMALAVFAGGLMLMGSGESIPVNGGFGWDGTAYRTIARDFWGEVFVSRVDAYRIQRVLPCAIVHYGLRLFRLSPSNDLHLQLGFQFYNLALLVLGVYLWNGIAEQLKLTRRGLWLGFLAIYVNFAVLKMTFYYPALTDTTALVLGLALVYGYLSGRAGITWTAALLGAFSWPPALPMGLLLMLFPRAVPLSLWERVRVRALRSPMASILHRLSAIIPPASTSPHPGPLPEGEGAEYSNPLSARWYFVPACALALLAMYRFYFRRQALPDIAPISDALVPLSAAVLLVYLALTFRGLIDRAVFARLLRPLREMTPRSVLAVVLLLAAVVLLKTLVLVPGDGRAYTLKQFLCNTLIASIGKPGLFLVSHGVYFGPIVLVTMLHGRRVCGHLRQLGLGAVLVAAFALLMSITSESRQLLSFLPLLVVVTIQAIEPLPLPRWHNALFLAAAVFASKRWLPWGHEPFTGDFLAYPDQSYFMNQGPYMSDGAFLLQAAVMLGLLVVFAVVHIQAARSRTVRCATDVRGANTPAHRSAA